MVTHEGSRPACNEQRQINLGTSLAGQAVGIKEVDDRIWLVSFMDYDLGYIDLEGEDSAAFKRPFWSGLSSCLRNLL